MKNPTLLMTNVTEEQALEIMDYLYCEFIRKTVKNHFENYIIWIDYNNNEVAKWTNEYRNIMISKDFLDFVKK